MKPPSMRTKDYVVRNLEASMGYEEGVVEKVVNFQWEDLIKATKLHNELEISGIGILLVSKNKVAKRIQEVENSLAKWKEKPTSSDIKTKIDFLEEKLIFLKGKQCQS